MYHTDFNESIGQIDQFWIFTDNLPVEAEARLSRHSAEEGKNGLVSLFGFGLSLIEVVVNPAETDVIQFI